MCISPKALWSSLNSIPTSTAEDTNSAFLNPSSFMVGISAGLLWNAGSTWNLGMYNTANTQHPLFPFSSDDTHRKLELEIARLTGERYTLTDRLRWIESSLADLRQQLHDMR